MVINETDKRRYCSTLETVSRKRNGASLKPEASSRYTGTPIKKETINDQPVVAISLKSM